MLKFLLVVIAFAAPIICGVIEENQNDSFVVKKTVERSSNGSIEDNTLKNCNATAAEILETERVESILNCVSKIDDFEQLLFEGFDTTMQSVNLAIKSNSTFSDQQNSATITYMKRYCANSKSILGCMNDTKALSIDECKTVEEKKYKTILSETFQRGSDFLCANNAERAEQFFNEKFIDCMILKNIEVKKCYLPYKLSDPSLSAVNFMCSSIEDFRNCLATNLDQCHFSKTLGTLTKSLLTYIQPDSCSTLL